MRPASLILFWILPVVVALCAVTANWYFGWPPRPIPPELGHATVDELIRLLPSEKDGTWDATVTTYVFDPAVDELTRRLDTGARMSDAQWRRALINSGAIQVRSEWPAKEPFAVSMRKPVWLGLAEIRCSPRTKGLRSAEAGELFQSTCGTALMGSMLAERYQELGVLTVGRHYIEFDVTVERGEESEYLRELMSPGAPPPGILWKGLMTFTVDAVANEDDVVPPVQGSKIDNAVRKSIAFYTYVSRGVKYVSICINPDPLVFPELSNTAVSLRVELLQNNEVVEAAELVAECYDSVTYPDAVRGLLHRGDGTATLKYLSPEVLDDANAQKEWSLRITSTTKDVMQFWNAKRRWSGAFVLPLREVPVRK
ncbi:MAG: hypothetical protein ACKVS6_13370 [Planctomycetota bacterium]